MTDVRTRIAMATQRFGKLRNIWRDGNLHLNLRMRLYKSCICSVLTYGSEAWKLTKKVTATLNGARQLEDDKCDHGKDDTRITGKTIREEASSGKTFDLVMWIRARRLQWLGHILRLGPGRTIK